MKLILIFLFFILNLLPRASLKDEAILEVTYSVTFKQFKDMDYNRKAILKLFVFDNKSVFVDNNALLMKQIRLKNISKEEKMRQFSVVQPASFKEVIYKDHTKNITTVIAENFQDQYIAYENPTISPEIWDIQSDVDSTITGLKVLKAKCDFGGRTWSAWFTPEIAVSDGPYKFSGLPGLILKLNSEDGEYSFQISGLSKHEKYNTSLILPEYQTISQDKFDDRIKYLSENPFALAEAKGGKIIGDISINGKLTSREEFTLFFKKEAERMNRIEKN